MTLKAGRITAFMKKTPAMDGGRRPQATTCVFKDRSGIQVRRLRRYAVPSAPGRVGGREEPRVSWRCPLAASKDKNTYKTTSCTQTLLGIIGRKSSF